MYARRLILAGSCLCLAAAVVRLGPGPARAAAQTASAAPGGAGDASAGDASAARQLNAANGLLNRGLHELAAREYRAFLDANPAHARAPVARYGLAACLYRTGDFAAATAELAQIPHQRDFEFAAEAIVMHGQCLVQLGRPGEAADVLVRLLREFADHELADDGAALLIEALYRADKPADAARQADAFTRRWADSPLRERVWLLGALADTSRGEWKSVIERCQAAWEAFPRSEHRTQLELLAAQAHEQLGGLDQAQRLYASAAQAASGALAADAWLSLAGVELRAGRAEAALHALERFVKAGDEHPRLADGLLLRGRVYYDQGRIAAAREDFARVERAGDAWADQAAYWLAKCALHERQHADAAERLARAIERFPQSRLLPEMRFDRAVALLRAGKTDEAAAALADFMATHRDHALKADALHLLATVEYQRGRFAECRTHCAAFEHEHGGHESAAAVAYLAAEAAYAQEQFAEAVEAFESLLRRFPQHAQADVARFRAGLCHYRLGRHDAALPGLRHAAERVSSDASWAASLLALGEIHLQKQDWAEAQRCFEAYLERGPGPAGKDDALLKLGLCHERAGRAAEALRCWERLLSDFPQSPLRLHALFEKGQRLVALERRDEAQRAFEQLLKADGASRFAPYALTHLGDLAQRRGAHTEAAGHFARAASLFSDPGLQADALLARTQALLAAQAYPEAETTARELASRLDGDPRGPTARAHFCVALARQEKAAEALSEIARLERDPPERLAEPLRDAVAYEKAWCLRKTDRGAEAAAAYRALLERRPDSELVPHATLELAELEAAAGRCDEAVRLLAALRESGDGFGRLPRDVRALALYRLGVCQVETGAFEAAAQALEAMLNEHKGHALTASALYFCGEAHFRLDRHARAAPLFRRLADEFADDAVLGPSLLRLGECCAVLQQWDRSERAFEAYLRKHPDGPQWRQAQFGIGYAREGQRRFDDAITAYGRVIAGHDGPTAARAQFQIGECLFAQNKHEQAVAELLKVDILYAHPEWSAAALYEAGRCLEALHKFPEARQQYEAVVKRFGQSRWAELAGRRLADAGGGGLPGKGGSN